jgi:hypothetical protein
MRLRWGRGFNYIIFCLQLQERLCSATLLFFVPSTWVDALFR